MKTGGLDNKEIPNFVYRWTEREIEKVINCYAPFSKHKINFFHAFSLTKLNHDLPFKNSLINLIQFTLKILPQNQGNLFGFFIEKPDLDKNSFPWILHKNNKLTLDKEGLVNWMKKH